MSSNLKESFKIMSNVSEKFKEIRQQNKLTQQNLADILSVKKQNISNIEGGLQNPSFELMKKLIENLNVNANWLIANVGGMYNQTPNEALKEELRKEFEELLKSKGL